MKNIDRKNLIIRRINAEKYEHIYEAMQALKGEINALEAVPAHLQNEPIRIAEDFSDGHIDGPESIERLKAFIGCIPD